MRTTCLAGLMAAIVAVGGFVRADEGGALRGGTELAPPGSSRAPRDAAEFDALFQQIKNWGRWGADDQLGSVNLITPATRKRAIALAKTGETVSLAHTLLTEKADDNASPFEHTMLRGNNMDRYAIQYHGYAHSHIDALCHILYKDQTYNGYARADVNTDKGCTKLGIQNLKAGLVARGVLVDIPRLRNVPYLEPGTAIYVEDLEAWEKKTGVKVGPGMRCCSAPDAGRAARRSVHGTSARAQRGCMRRWRPGSRRAASLFSAATRRKTSRRRWWRVWRCRSTR